MIRIFIIFLPILFFNVIKSYSYEIREKFFELDYQSHYFENNIFKIECDYARIVIQPYSDTIICVRYYHDADTVPAKSYSVIKEPEPGPWLLILLKTVII